MLISIYREEDKEYSDLLRQHIRDFNDLLSPYLEMGREDGFTKHYNLEVKDGETFIGGLTSRIFWNLMEIDNVFIQKDFRHKGHGKKLLDMAIAFAKEENLNFIILQTFSFEAAEFYKKMGFFVVGEIENYPPGSSKYTLRYELKNSK
mgnify:CR=1 FL=1|jgi:ribosomal protein S18 acetylase RimI-like enzyme